MKKTLLLAAAIACSGAVAQEKQVWACQMEESTMLRWEDNGWKNYAVKPYNILLTLNADNTVMIKLYNKFSILGINCELIGC